MRILSSWTAGLLLVVHVEHAGTNSKRVAPDADQRPPTGSQTTQPEPLVPQPPAAPRPKTSTHRPGASTNIRRQRRPPGPSVRPGKQAQGETAAEPENGASSEGRERSRMP
eukprot:158038-Rhodomonas_salina.1